MMSITLNQREKTGKRFARQLRRSGQVPGIIYGENQAARYFSLPGNTVAKIMKEEGTSSLLDVSFAGEAKPVKALLHDWQNNPLSGAPSHIDLYQVRMDHAIHTELPINFIGVAAAIKDLGGILVKQIHHLPIECLPGDLISSLDVSIEPLKIFTDTVKVKDLSVPRAIKVLLDPEAIVVGVSEPRSQAELEALQGEVKADVSAVEVLTEKKEKVEGEEAAPVEKKPIEKK